MELITCSLLSLQQIVGVAQVINKKNEEGPFTANDEKIFERYLTFCGIGITNALLFQSSVIMYKRSDVSCVLCGCFYNISNYSVSMTQLTSTSSTLLTIITPSPTPGPLFQSLITFSPGPSLWSC